jgi:hypothetical protein
VADFIASIHNVVEALNVAPPVEKKEELLFERIKKLKNEVRELKKLNLPIAFENRVVKVINDCDFIIDRDELKKEILDKEKEILDKEKVIDYLVTTDGIVFKPHLKGDKEDECSIKHLGNQIYEISYFDHDKQGYSVAEQNLINTQMILFPSSIRTIVLK